VPASVAGHPQLVVVVDQCADVTDDDRFAHSEPAAFAAASALPHSESVTTTSLVWHAWRFIRPDNIEIGNLAPRVQTRVFTSSSSRRPQGNAQGGDV